MRIVYIHQYYRTPEMSGGTRSYEFARRLVAAGHDVQVVTSDEGGSVPPRRQALWRTTVEAGARVHWTPVAYNNKMGYRQRIAAFGRFARLAASRAAGLEQDIVFATSTPLTIALPGVYSAWRNKVPMVLEVRDLWPEVPIAVGALRSRPSRAAARALEKWAYTNAAHVVALSPAMAEGVRRRDSRVPTTVIPNAADVELFEGADKAGSRLREATPWLGRRPLILYAGTLGFANGVEYLVRLAASLRTMAPDVRIAIVGTGREEGALRSLAAELGVLDTNLHMIGQVSKSDVVAYFGACDLACSTFINLPALTANSPNKAFDTWAAGKPLAINHGGWLGKIIEETGAGVVMPPGDPVGAAGLIAEFLADERRASSARTAARALADGRFSRDRLFKEFEGVLNDVAVGSRRRKVRA
jgi:glycosyltransferase involved in cell wall biosynthesis